MKKLTMNQTRTEFLKFFESKNHTIVKSFSLIPEDDDSLLLINAGMAPLKKYFTGEKRIKNNRASSSQKCIRTADIDVVGKTQRHCTFFEMLGNFSFGDYFKKEAIQWAWEFLTKVVGLDESILWVSVYQDDDEAFEIWEKTVGVPREKIVRLGKKDNFWELEEGPCGPCSEIYVDRGEYYGPISEENYPGGDGPRFVEVWNLVFTQFNKTKEGEYNKLAHPNIDTGMGLERLSMVLQSVDNVYEIDTMQDIITEIERQNSDIKYHKDKQQDVSIRIIADHAKAIAFLVADGVVPSNEGRGYVLRRILRRAARHGRLLGIRHCFLNTIVDKVIENYKGEYPELARDRERIATIILREEEKFYETIDKGLERLEDLMSEVKESDNKQISAAEVFKLYDTYGFPIDLTKEILLEKELSFDEDGFQSLMNAQRERSRQARNTENVGWSGKNTDLLKELEKTDFVGYDQLNTDAIIETLIVDSQKVNEIHKGEAGYLVLDKTSFYGEGGGQIGDTGYMLKDGAQILVTNTIKNKNNAIIHEVLVKEGTFRVNDSVVVRVDENRRRDIMKNHSATHLLNQALKDVLGPHIQQAGSLVSAERLRFDITHYEAISSEDLMKVQDIVNQVIALGLKVNIDEMSLEESQKKGAVGLFEDKYQDIVRVVSMGDYSKELCGGTHVESTSDIQMFKILSESSVGSGIRRIEAITGRACYQHYKKLIELSEKAKALLHIQNTEEILKEIENRLDTISNLEKEIERAKQSNLSSRIEDIVKSSREVKGIKIYTASLQDIDINSAKNFVDVIRNHVQSGIIVLAVLNEDKFNFICSVSDDIVSKNISAGNIVRMVAQYTGGNGGGKKDFAMAGGKDQSKIDEAFQQIDSYIETNMSK